jgi:DNA-directed RNA polymerase subunit E'/Rpb7
MTSKMFMPIKFNTTIILIPNELTRDFDRTIINKVKNTLENCCSKHGYIKKDTIKIIKRSAGYFKESHLNGNVAFDVSCIAEICNPSQDSVIKCEVKSKNNLGLRAIGMYEDMAILEVCIPKITSGIQSEVNIDNINIGDIVNVQVCGKKFTLYDKMISIIGKIIKDKDDVIEVKEVDEDDLSIDEEEDSELDESVYDGIELFNEDEEDDEDDELNVYKSLNENSKGSKTRGGSIFDEEENEEEEDNEDENLEDDDLEYDEDGDVDESQFDDPNGEYDF